MARQDTMDFVAAFAIGAVLGVGATLLLRGDGEHDAKRLLDEIAPLRRSAEKRMHDARKQVRRRQRRAESTGAVVARAGRAALGDLRGQVADIVASAQKDIVSAARRSVRDAARAAREGLAS